MRNGPINYLFPSKQKFLDETLPVDTADCDSGWDRVVTKKANKNRHVTYSLLRGERMKGALFLSPSGVSVLNFIFPDPLWGHGVYILAPPLCREFKILPE